MASSYSATLLQNAIYKAQKKDMFQSFELRGSTYGALEAALRQESQLLPKSTLEKLKKASGHVVEIDVFKREPLGNGTARKCSGTGAGSTARVALVWQTITEEFAISHLDLAGNDYSYEELFQKRFEERLRSLYTRWDAAVVAALDANFSAGNGDKFIRFMDAAQVPLSNYDMSTNRSAMWANKAKAEAFQNDISMDNIRWVGDSGLMELTSAMLNQGQGTATNLGFQFQGMGFDYSNRVQNNEGRYATGYMFEPGMFSFLTWINKLEKDGKDIGTDIWTSFAEPKYGKQVGLKIKKTCADNSATLGAGTESDLTESYVMAVDIAIPFAYTSDDNTGVYKYEFDIDNDIQSGSGSYE